MVGVKNRGRTNSVRQFRAPSKRGVLVRRTWAVHDSWPRDFAPGAQYRRKCARYKHFPVDS